MTFGHEWNSSLSYNSERKSFTVPNWYLNYNDVSRNPQKYMGNVRAGAIVFCPSNPEQFKLLVNPAKIIEVDNCKIYILN